MAARIPPVDGPDAVQAAELAKTPARADGAPLNVFTTLAHRPRLLRRVNALGGYFARDSDLPARERELAILRTAARVGCGYELAHHRVLATAAGLGEAETAAAADPGVAHAWGAADAALLGFVDELVATRSVSDGAWRRLGHLGDGGRLDLLLLVGFYAMLGGMLEAVCVEVDAPAG